MTNTFLGPLIAAALGARGKRHRRAARFFGGGHRGSFWNASTLLTAFGLGVGAYEVFRSRMKGPATSTVVVDDPPTGAAGAGGSGSALPPPLPPGAAPERASPATPSLRDGPERLIRLMVAAARADGELGEEEYGRLVREARAIGAESIVEAERKAARPLAEIVSGVVDPTQKRELYVVAYGIVRADEEVTAPERMWLARLASLLGLDRASVEKIEKETDARIAAGAEEDR